MKWPLLTQRVQTWLEEAQEHFDEGVLPRAVAVVIAIYFTLMIALGIYWSREPAQFSVAAVTVELLKKDNTHPAVGSTSTATLIRVTATLLQKPGGLLSNDIMPPGVWLDNMPAWENGVIVQARDFARAMREAFSRAQSQSPEDEDLGKAEPRLNFSITSWAVPSSESEYRDAIDYLQSYLQRLQQSGDRRAQFYPRADNLDVWLAAVTTRLSDLSRRLSECVKPRENPALPTSSSDSAAALMPWNKIDDVFYEARGSAWALLHFLRAVEIDFADVLQQKNAQTELHQIIRDLEATQEPIYSPVILNGGGFGMLANHSLVMASYIARADAGLISVRERLAK